MRAVMLILILGAPLGRAQAPVQVVRFSVFSPKPVKGIAFVPRAKAPPQKIVFQPTARSVRHEYRGPMPLKFIDSESGAVVAEATIPASIRDALLLFSPVEAPSGASGLRYQVAVLDDGPGRHAAGGFAMINLSGLALSGSINGEKVTLRPGLNSTVTLRGPAEIVLGAVHKNRRYHSYAGTVTLRRNERALLILFPPFYTGSLEVQSRLLIDQPPGSAAARR